MELRRRPAVAVLSIELPGLRDITREIEGEIAGAAATAMRGTTYKAVRELRRQVTSAGMSQRLANTWRDRVYPERRASMTPTGYIWSNAPDIINAFDRGVTIRPVNGSEYLWIPTNNVPRARGRVSVRGRNMKGGSMSPEEVKERLRANFVFRRGKAGTLLAFMDLIAARNGRGYRIATPGRKRQQREAELVLMFVLRRTVRMPKLFNLDAAADRWAADYQAEFLRLMGG